MGLLAKYGLMVQKLINQFSSTTNKEYLPDLVKQIIQEHILPEFDCGTEEEKQINLQKLSSEYNPKATGLSLGAFFALRGQLKRLEPTFILEVSKEVMKLI